MIQVEGSITVRGNVPFNAVVLETEDNNSYILIMDDSTRAALTTPSWATVSGHLYLGTWNDVPWAHIGVTELNQRK